MSTVPPFLRALVDDAAIFPPGEAPLPEAVRAHRRHRQAAYADLVGPFVVSDARLPDLLEQVREQPGEDGSDGAGPLSVSVVVTGGAGAIEPAVRWAGDSGVLALRGVEIALRDEADLAHNARRVVTAVDQLVASGHLDDDTAVYVEPPRLYGEPPPHSWLAALDELATMDHRLKFRTGGVTAEAFPSAAELASCLDAALDRELRFKCTAGLHHAVRRRVDEGFEDPVDQHGFLNVLLATRATLDGAPAEEVRSVLEERDPDAVADAVRRAGEDALAAARRWFASFGSCSVREPLDDLVTLGLMPDLTLEDA
ncbi:MAG TPA: hypothetical protein VF049_03835 [Nocardioidaceae bacterium]